MRSSRNFIAFGVVGLLNVLGGQLAQLGLRIWGGPGPGMRFALGGLVS